MKTNAVGNTALAARIFAVVGPIRFPRLIRVIVFVADINTLALAGKREKYVWLAYFPMPIMYGALTARGSIMEENQSHK